MRVEVVLLDLSAAIQQTVTLPHLHSYTKMQATGGCVFQSPSTCRPPTTHPCFTTFTSHPGRHIHDMIRHSQLHLEVLPSQIHKNHLKCPCVSTVEFFLKDASK